MFIRPSYDYSKVREKIYTMCFIGMEEDVSACISTIQFAIKVAESCWKAYKENGNVDTSRGYNGNKSAGVKNRYLQGFILGLEDSFKENVKEKGLMIVKDQLVTEEYAKMNFGKAAKSKIVSSNDMKAYSKGFQDGKMSKKDRYIA